VPGPSCLQAKIAVAKFKKFISLGSDQISAELVQAGGAILRSEVHELIQPISNKVEYPDQ
jgi:hypothetical protein